MGREDSREMNWETDKARAIQQTEEQIWGKEKSSLSATLSFTGYSGI